MIDESGRRALTKTATVLIGVTMLIAQDADAAAARHTRAQVGGWRYADHTNSMGERDIKACTTSLGVVTQRWPYAASRVNLCIRRVNAADPDVWVQLQGRGQLLKDDARIRFDQDEPQGVDADNEADGSNESLFLSPPNWAVRHIQAAKRVTVEFTVYAAGTQHVVFNTAGLRFPEVGPDEVKAIASSMAGILTGANTPPAAVEAKQSPR